MPRKKKWPPSRLPHKPSGRERIRVGGVDHWLGPIGSEEADAEYKRLIVELANAESKPAVLARPSGGKTVAAVAALWIEGVLPKHTPEEASQYRRALLVLVRVAGKEIAADFDEGSLERVRDAMIAGSWLTPGERKKLKALSKPPDWCRNHTNRQIVRIRTVWRWLEKRKHIPKGSWAGLRALEGLPPGSPQARHTKKTLPVSWDDLQKVIAHVRSTARWMLLFQWWTGARSGEVRKMRVEEVDRSGPVWIYRPATHKNAWRGHDRVIAIGPEAQAILSRFLRGKRPGAFAFLTRNGKPYTANAYGLCGIRAGKAAGLPWFRPYCCRHAAKQRITRELGLDAARAALGQKSLGTANDYGEAVDLELAVGAAKRCG